MQTGLACQRPGADAHRLVDAPHCPVRPVRRPPAASRAEGHEQSAQRGVFRTVLRLPATARTGTGERARSERAQGAHRPIWAVSVACWSTQGGARARSRACGVAWPPPPRRRLRPTGHRAAGELPGEEASDGGRSAKNSQTLRCHAWRCRSASGRRCAGQAEGARSQLRGAPFRGSRPPNHWPPGMPWQLPLFARKAASDCDRLYVRMRRPARGCQV